MGLQNNSIQEALMIFTRNSGDRWPLPLVAALRRDQSLDWVYCIIRESTSDPNRKNDIATWKRRLESMIRSGSSPSEVVRSARELWYEGGNRDQCQTAMVRLYEANAKFMEDDTERGLRLLAAAIQVIATDVTGRTSQDRVNQIIETFRTRQSIEGD